MNVITEANENTRKQPLIVKKTVMKETQELRKIYNTYHDESNGIIENSHSKVEGIVVDVLGEEFISPA